jgi:calcyclin binding protein
MSLEGAVSPSHERLLDAQEIEQAAASLSRPTARLHLESLAKKLRRESEALLRIETSQRETETSKDNSSASAQEVPEASQKTARIPAAPVISSTQAYTSVDRFSFDAGGYNAPWVTLYVPLPGVGSIPKENVSCNFTSKSLDLIVKDLNGKSFRLFRDNLDKDIDPDKSKFLVKSDEVRVKLAKIKQKDYGGYDYWTELTSKKKLSIDTKKAEDPQSSIMQLMKDMYDSGDDNMKKMIGETMMKQKTGQLNDKMPGMDDF